MQDRFLKKKFKRISNAGSGSKSESELLIKSFDSSPKLAKNVSFMMLSWKG
jgi:hypothetical protein